MMPIADFSLCTRMFLSKLMDVTTWTAMHMEAAVSLLTLTV